LPAEFRTVPDTVTTGRDSAVGICASIADDKQSNSAATAKDTHIHARCICK
jgi:hypothetical protein